MLPAMHTYKYHMNEEQRMKVGQHPLRSKVDYPDVRDRCTPEYFNGTKEYQYTGRLSKTNKGWIKSKIQRAEEERQRKESIKVNSPNPVAALRKKYSSLAMKLNRMMKIFRLYCRKVLNVKKRVWVFESQLEHEYKRKTSHSICTRKRRRGGGGTEGNHHDATMNVLMNELCDREEVVQGECNRCAEKQAELEVLEEKSTSRNNELSRRENILKSREEDHDRRENELCKSETKVRNKETELSLRESDMRDKINVMNLELKRREEAATAKHAELNSALKSLKEELEQVHREQSSVDSKRASAENMLQMLSLEREKVRIMEEDVSRRDSEVAVAKRKLLEKQTLVDCIEKFYEHTDEELEERMKSLGLVRSDFVDKETFSRRPESFSEIIWRLYWTVLYKDRLIRDLQSELRRTRREAIGEENQLPQNFYTYLVCLARECFRQRGICFQNILPLPVMGMIGTKPARTLHCFLSFDTSRLLAQGAKIIVIDTENLCHSEKLKRKDFLMAIPFLRKLAKYGFHSELVLPARRAKSQWDNISKLKNEKLLSSVNACIRYVDSRYDDTDDHMVLRMALEKHALILSNDMYRDYYMNPENSRGLSNYLSKWQLHFNHEQAQLLTTSRVPVTESNIGRYLLHDRQTIGQNISDWIFDDIMTSFAGESQLNHADGDLLDPSGFVQKYMKRLRLMHHPIPMGIRI